MAQERSHTLDCHWAGRLGSLGWQGGETVDDQVKLRDEYDKGSVTDHQMADRLLCWLAMRGRQKGTALGHANVGVRSRSVSIPMPSQAYPTSTLLSRGGAESGLLQLPY